MEKMMNQIPNCFYRISIKGLFLNPERNKFLIVQEEDGRWDLPGGGMKFGESPNDCLRREIKQEMGLELSSIAERPSYLFTAQFQREELRGLWYANVLYEVTTPHFNFTPSEECIACRFVSPEETETLHVYNSIEQLSFLLLAKE